MGLRERFSGKWCWTLNMEVHGKGRVVVSLLGHIRWVYGRILGRIGRSFCSHTRFEVRDVVPRLDSGHDL
jgi:hypothetical protein